MRAVIHPSRVRERTTESRWLVLTVMCVGYFLVLLDVTVVNVALPKIGSGLHASVSGLQWVVDGYAVVLAALLLASGTIGDLRGHKRIVLVGLAVFGLASLGCALAPDTGVLVVGRVVQGVGAALLLPGTLAIIGRTFSERAEQARAIGIWAGVGSVALPVGPLLGGALVEGGGWRWIFLLNVPVVVLAGLVALRVVPDDAGRRDVRLDLAGTVLAALTLAALTFAVIEAGRAGAGAATLAAAAIAVLALIAFVRVEARVPAPMLPLRLFTRAGFATANGTAGIMNLGTLGLLFLLTLFLQDVQGRTALAAGVAVLPLVLPLSILAPLAGRLTARTGPALPMSAGFVLAAVGTGLLATWQRGTGYLALLPGMLCWGVGLGVVTPAVVAAAIASAPADKSGLASGVNNTARQAGGAIGIATFGAIAGQPGTRGFLGGLHATALLTAALFLAAALITLVFLRKPDAFRR